ncbi:hypothetical protein LOC67_08820 [Stieleria sp. JC731]|uniref:hypothetical protein n=1 Tax=Pirellulaceae TaxID=2691357 RepID=UPI001E5E54E4|nr:hypothetical protein [Stieleria sp. JC731]MCC9600663.1 hypothetical protein [Stieleria sp. JC731]
MALAPLFRKTVCVLSLAFASSVTCYAASGGMTTGPIELQAIGPMAFTESGILLVGDPKAATVYAINLEDTEGDATTPKIDDLVAAIKTALSVSGDVEVGELAVNPATGNSFVSVKADGRIHLVRIDGADQISQVNLDKIGHATKVLPNAPEDREVTQGRRSRNNRNSSITDLAYFEGKVMVSGLSAGDSPSRVIEFPFPFAENTIATSVEIFHAAHGRVESGSPIQTFLPMMVDGEPSLLAGYTCTPLVRFTVDDLGGDQKVRGTTIAELGNRNQPLDMIVYEKEGKTSILLSNSARGVMKISADGIEDQESLSERVSGGGTAGQPFETVEALQGVKQMDKLNASKAVVIADVKGKLALQTIELP